MALFRVFTLNYVITIDVKATRTNRLPMLLLIDMNYLQSIHPAQVPLKIVDRQLIIGN